MKIELRNIQYSAALSDDTNAFTATLYINGKKAGTAKNDGGGGPTDYSPIYNMAKRCWDEASQKLIAEAEAWTKTLPKETVDVGLGKSFTYQPDLESIIDKLLVEHLKAKDAAKKLKRMDTHVSYGIPGHNSYYEIKLKKKVSEMNVLERINLVKSITKNLKEGEVIFNTNLPIQVHA